jgi:hypothetical protein
LPCLALTDLQLILQNEDKLRSADLFDRIVCAEIPDPVTQPRLHAIVTRCMMHGPCGSSHPDAPCMKDGVCSKKFPRAFASESSQDSNGYPVYRRRVDGRSVRNKGKFLDNRYVVPYNPYLTEKYNAHINIEICSSIASVKYLYKYVFKGHDCATIEIQQNDEISNYLNGRYISASEACWRIFSLPHHERSHTVNRLSVHLPDQQRVRFGEDMTPQIVLDRARTTKLLQFFNLNRSDPTAHQYAYVEIPQHYTWVNNNWKRRQRGGDRVVTRIYNVSPRDTELYHLRLLLLHQKGCMSFEDVRTVRGVMYPTYQEAAAALGLLDDDREWDQCLEEAAAKEMPRHLRQLFATILAYCNVSNIAQLWHGHIQSMSEDFMRRFGVTVIDDRIQVAVLRDIDQFLINSGTTYKNYKMHS